MTWSDWDKALLALCAWREDRSGQREGMLAVMCSVRNRVERGNKSYSSAITQKWQYSSMTAPGDPQLGLYPQGGDPIFELALSLVDDVIDGAIADTTGGATNYYADSMTVPPKWADSMTFTVAIGGQRFFK